MSFIQVDLNVFPKAQVLSGCAGIGYSQALGGLLRLWDWCFERRSLEVERQLIGAFFDSSDASDACDRIVRGLISIGFADANGPDSLRVRDEKDRLGLNKLMRLQNGAAKAREKKRINARSTPDQARDQGPINVDQRLIEAKKDADQPPDQGPINVDHQPHRSNDPEIHTFKRSADEPLERPALTRGDTDRKSAPDVQGSLLPNAEQEVKGRDATKASKAHKGKEEPSDWHELIRRLADVFLRLKGSLYGFSSRDFGAVKKLRAIASDDEIATRWERALHASGFDHCSALHELENKWNRHTSPQQSSSQRSSPQSSMPSRNEGIRSPPPSSSDAIYETVRSWIPDAPEATISEMARCIDGGEPSLIPWWLESLGYHPTVIESAKQWAATQAAH